MQSDYHLVRVAVMPMTGMLVDLDGLVHNRGLGGLGCKPCEPAPIPACRIHLGHSVDRHTLLVVRAASLNPFSHYICSTLCVWR